MFRNSRLTDKPMICSWNTGKKWVVEKHIGESDCPNAGLENNNGKLRAWKVTQLASEI